MNRQKRKIRMVGMDLDGTLFNNEKSSLIIRKKFSQKLLSRV